MASTRKKKSKPSKSSSSCPVDLLALAQRIEKHYTNHGFDEINVDVDDIERDDPNWVPIILMGCGDSDYFDQGLFTESLWYDVTDTFSIECYSQSELMTRRAKGKPDPIWEVSQQAFAESEEDLRERAIPGKIMCYWSHGEELSLTFVWTPPS